MDDRLKVARSKHHPDRGWSSFSAVAVFLRHQLIKGGLSLKMRKSGLNVTQESWFRHWAGRMWSSDLMGPELKGI